MPQGVPVVWWNNGIWTGEPLDTGRSTTSTCVYTSFLSLLLYNQKDRKRTSCIYTYSQEIRDIRCLRQQWYVSILPA